MVSNQKPNGLVLGNFVSLAVHLRESRQDLGGPALRAHKVLRVAPLTVYPCSLSMFIYHD